MNLLQKLKIHLHPEFRIFLVFDRVVMECVLYSSMPSARLILGNRLGAWDLLFGEDCDVEPNL